MIPDGPSADSLLDVCCRIYSAVAGLPSFSTINPEDYDKKAIEVMKHALALVDQVNVWDEDPVGWEAQNAMQKEGPDGGQG